MSVTEITDAWVEGSAEELYHQASRGKPWQSAPRDVREHFLTVTRRVLNHGRVAEIAHRSQRQAERKSVLP